MFVVASSTSAVAQTAPRRPLTVADIDGIAQLVMLEDTRQFDETVLTTLLASAHPEVRRRAVIAVGRIVEPGRAGACSCPRARMTDVEIVATVAFATGQLKDPDAVPWLSELLIGQEHTARSRPRGGAGARQDSDAGGTHRARAVPGGGP